MSSVIYYCWLITSCLTKRDRYEDARWPHPRRQMTRLLLVMYAANNYHKLFKIIPICGFLSLLCWENLTAIIWDKSMIFVLNKYYLSILKVKIQTAARTRKKIIVMYLCKMLMLCIKRRLPAFGITQKRFTAIFNNLVKTGGRILFTLFFFNILKKNITLSQRLVI